MSLHAAAARSAALLRPLCLALGPALLAGCSRSTDASSSAAPKAQPLAPRALAVACGDRAGCQSGGVVEAGKDGSGRALAVVTVLLPPHPEWDCQPTETWLVAAPPAGDAARVRLLSQNVRCRPDVDPLPQVTVLGPQRVQFVEHKTFWQDPMTLTYELALDPPAVVHLSERRHGTTVGIPALTGEPHFPGMDCQLDGDAGACDESVTMPQVTIADGAAFAKDGWKTTSLGDCAALIDGTHGLAKPAGAGSASVRAVMTADALYVEVTDDAFVTKGPVVDRLDVELESIAGFPGDRQLGRVTMDGAWHMQNELGKYPRQGRVEVAEVPPNTRRIKLAGWVDAWATVTYEDTDDGKAIRQTMASDGILMRFDPKFTDCVADQGTLRVRQKTGPGVNEHPKGPPLLP